MAWHGHYHTIYTLIYANACYIFYGYLNYNTTNYKDFIIWILPHNLKKQRSFLKIQYMDIPDDSHWTLTCQVDNKTSKNIFYGLYM